MEKLISFFYEELFYKSNQNLQDPIVFQAMTRLRSLSSRRWWELQEKNLLELLEKNPEEKLEEREGREHVQLLHKGDFGVNPWRELHEDVQHLCSSIYSLKPSPLCLLLEVPLQ